MKRIPKEEKQRAEELFRLILKKAGMSYREFLFIEKHNLVASNLDMLTEEEKEKYGMKD